MTQPLARHQKLGSSGLSLPPVVFSAAALGNVGRVISEQSKLAICGEWFRQVAPPIAIEVSYDDGDGAALEVLGRLLRRLDVPGNEVVVQLTISGNGVLPEWEKSCLLLPTEYRPQLVAVRGADASSWEAAHKLKTSGEVRGVGVALSLADVSATIFEYDAADFVTICGCTVLRHTSPMLEFINSLESRASPIVASGVFEGGCLVGGGRLDGRALNGHDTADRSLLAWRKAFVALCDGHGISPAHACIQFALSAPGVMALRLGTSYADRVAENVAAICHEVPRNFWQSMQEERLLSEGDPIAG